MTSETRKLTDEQIIDIFRHTTRTAEMKIHDIEYYHYENSPDTYIVNMDDGHKYAFQQAEKYSRMINPRNYSVYNRIVRIK